MSISPTFYEQLFCTKVFCTAFMCLQFGFVIFWQKKIGAKAAHKMLVKLTTDGKLESAHYKCYLFNNCKTHLNGVQLGPD